MLASSSRRESRPEKNSHSQAKRVGCMSGIFYFLHLHRHNSRKRLPSGKRDNKTIVSPAPPRPESKASAAAEPAEKTSNNKRSPRPEAVVPATAEPTEKTSHNKRSARSEAVAPATAKPTEKTSHNKRSARSEAAAPAAVADTGDKTSHNKRAANSEDAATAANAVSNGGPSRRLSCDVPRSPTLRSEIRRSNSAGSTPRRPPALVARLMGLDDPPPDDTPESAAEKRRKLLGALERCDEDLRALKKIIEALRVAESRRELTAAGLADRGGRATPKHSDAVDSEVEEKRCLEVDGEQPSPVSVLDALSSPPARRISNRWVTARGSQIGDAASAIRSKQQPRPIAAPPTGTGEAGVDISNPHLYRFQLHTVPRRLLSSQVQSRRYIKMGGKLQTWGKPMHGLNPTERARDHDGAGRHDKDPRVTVDGQNHLLRRNANIEALPRGAAADRRSEALPFLDLQVAPRQTGSSTSRPWRRLPCSRAMEESVDQVWEDGVWEERWELGRVGLGLEGDILGDLVAEVVKELGFRRCGRPLQLPFDACRKRLCY